MRVLAVWLALSEECSHDLDTAAAHGELDRFLAGVLAHTNHVVERGAAGDLGAVDLDDVIVGVSGIRPVEADGAD